jgi:hypothetical protein
MSVLMVLLALQSLLVIPPAFPTSFRLFVFYCTIVLWPMPRIETKLWAELLLFHMKSGEHFAGPSPPLRLSSEKNVEKATSTLMNK